MKKSRLILAVLLLAALALSLTACAGKNTGEDPGSTPGGTGNPGGTSSSETVFQAEFMDLNWQGEMLSPVLFTDQGVYVSVDEITGTRTFEGDLSWKGSYNIYEARYYFIGFDGSVRKLENYQPVELMEKQENFSNFNPGNSIYRMAVNQEGKLVAVERASVTYFDLPEGVSAASENYYNYYKWEEGIFLRVLDTDGSEISRARIQVDEDTYLDIRNLLLDADGNALITCSDSVLAVAEDGSIAYSIALKPDDYPDQLFLLGDGRVCLSVWAEQGSAFQIIDPENRCLGQRYDSPDPNGYLEPVTGDGTYDFYYTSGTNFYGCDLEAGTRELLLNWMDCNVGYTGITPRLTADGSISGLVSNWGSGVTTVPPQLFTLKRVPADSVPQKHTLTLAGLYFSANMYSKVLDYNRSHSDYAIQVVDYSEFRTDEDYEAGRTKLLTEIMAGQMPDILCLNGLPYTQLAAKGLLADIYPYLDADSQLNREDFLENVFSALEVNGGLYQVADSFSVYTVMGARSAVGDAPGWTFEDMRAALDKMPEDCMLFGDILLEPLFREWLAMDIDSYVDWGTGTCRFDSPEFVELLEMVRRYGRDESYFENIAYAPDDTLTKQLAEGRRLLVSTGIYSLDLYTVYQEYYFGQDADVTYVGYPTRVGTGNALSVGRGYAISARSDYKDAAWDFLRTSLTDEEQQKVYNLPVSKKVLEAKLEALSQPSYRTNADGSFVLDGNGQKIADTVTVSLPGGIEFEYDRLTTTQIDRLRQLITGTTRSYGPADSILDIVISETQAFFSGQKTAQEVASLIQGKANIYINEQR